jgi:hypothetical protein
MVLPNGLNEPTLGIYTRYPLTYPYNQLLPCSYYSYLVVRYKTIVVTVVKLLVDSLILLIETLIDNTIYIP